MTRSLGLALGTIGSVVLLGLSLTRRRQRPRHHRDDLAPPPIRLTGLYRVGQQVEARLTVGDEQRLGWPVAARLVAIDEQGQRHEPVGVLRQASNLPLGETHTFAIPTTVSRLTLQLDLGAGSPALLLTDQPINDPAAQSLRDAA